MRVCDVCGQELVPCMGTWLCPDSAAVVDAQLRNSGPALTEEEA